MLIEVILASAFVGLLVVFWFTPIGVPTLRRLGCGQMSPDLQFGCAGEDVYVLLDIYGAKVLSYLTLAVPLLHWGAMRMGWPV